MRRLLFLATLFLSACAGSGAGSSNPGDRNVSVLDVPAETKDSRCSKLTVDRQSYSYCVYDPAGRIGPTPYPGFFNVDIIYYWHGLNETPESVEQRNIVRAMYSELGRSTPVIVSVSTGPRGIVADQMASDFVTKVVPQIENLIVRPGLRITRVMAGASMGGYNALRITAAKPEAFAGVIALCPALISFDPFDAQEIRAYKQRHREYLNGPFFEEVLAAFKRRFSTAAQWKANDPFGFLRANRYDSVALKLGVGNRDDLGFREGVEAFQKVAGRGPNYNRFYDYVDGGHCAFDMKGTLIFLQLYMGGQFGR